MKNPFLLPQKSRCSGKIPPDPKNYVAQLLPGVWQRVDGGLLLLLIAIRETTQESLVL